MRKLVLLKVIFLLFSVTVSQDLEIANTIASLKASEGKQYKGASFVHAAKKIVNSLKLFSSGSAQPSPTESFLEVEQTKLRSGRCLYGLFKGKQFDLTASNLIFETKTSSSFSLESCAEKCSEKATCKVFYFSPTNCVLVTDFPDATFNSGVCIMRGGCDAVEGSNQCVWSNYEGAQLSPAFGSATTVTLSSEVACQSRCESELTCLGFQFSGTTCSLLSSLKSDIGTTGVCFEGLQLEKSSGTCEENEKCIVKVQVPDSLGDTLVKVETTVVPTTGSYVSSVVRSSSGTAKFSLELTGSGDYTLSFSPTSSVSCPVTQIITNSALSLNTTYFIWDKNFPVERGYFLIKYKMQCSRNLLAIILLFILVIFCGISLLSPFKLLTRTFVEFFFSTAGMTLGVLFLSDFLQSFKDYQCEKFMISPIQPTN
eukprot:c15894_g1_i1.p1 GENE.c15894_g1_i1~~c15894_g1_i1.p1  ORF type:complete len:427 (+),score=121.26 c15894_g1_i1:43-1323(+)